MSNDRKSLGRALRYWWLRPSGAKAVLAISLPLIISTASWTIMHFCDRLFLYWHSKQAVAASMPAGMVYYCMLCFPMGLAGYVTTFVAQYYGAKRYDRIGLATWQGVWIGCLATPCFLFMIPLAPFIFGLANHGTEIARLEAIYFQVMTFGAGAGVLSIALSSFFTGLGETKIVMVVNSLAAVVNFILDYALIFGHFGLPKMGIVGAGLATAISQWFTVLAFAIVMVRGAYGRYELRKGCRFDRKLISRIVRYGGPSGFQMFIEMTAFTSFLLILGRLGENELAATNVVFSINGMAFVPMLGLGMAVTALVGQHLGNDRPDLAARATWTSFILGAVYTGLFALSFVFVPNLFLAGHAAGNQADFQSVQAVSLMLLRYVALYCVLDMTHIVFVSAIKGAGDTPFVLLVTAITAPIPVALAWFGERLWNWDLSHFWTVITAWICLLGLVYFARFQQGKWRTMRVIEETPPNVAEETPMIETVA